MTVYVCIAWLNFKNYFATAFLGICSKVTMHLPMSSTFHRHYMHEAPSLLISLLWICETSFFLSVSLLFAMIINVAYFGFSHSDRFFGWIFMRSNSCSRRNSIKKRTNNYWRKLDRLDGTIQILQQQQQQNWANDYFQH